MSAKRRHLPDNTDTLVQETVNTVYPSTKLLTVEDLCSRFQVRRSWVYNQTKEHGPGSMPRIRLGKYLRFDESAVMEWLAGKQTASRE